MGGRSAARESRSKARKEDKGKERRKDRLKQEQDEYKEGMVDGMEKVSRKGTN